MKLCMVFEFQKDNSQIYRLFENNKAAFQDKMNVDTVILNPITLSKYSYRDDYWNSIREADVVFVYSTRARSYDEDKDWKWYNIGKHVKNFMNQDAKLIIMEDSDYVFVEHPEWVWWREDELTGAEGLTPEEFFDKTGVLDVGDVYFSVIENPPFRKYLSNDKKFFKIWLPHLSFKGYNFDKFNKLCSYKSNRIGLMCHSSRVASVEHTIENIIKPLDIPVCYFNVKRDYTMEMGQKECRAKQYPKGSMIIGAELYTPIYMMRVNNCFCGIDDAENYIGWSRFAMECAIVGIPCIGSTESVKDLFPDLYTEHKDYIKQTELLNKIINDKDFYDYTVKNARNLLSDLNDPKKVIDNFLSIFQSIGVDIYDEKRKRLKREYKKLEYAFIELLAANLPFQVPSTKPQDTQYVFDKVVKKTLNSTDWEEHYGKYSDFIMSEKNFTSFIKLALIYQDKKEHKYNDEENAFLDNLANMAVKI